MILTITDYLAATCGALAVLLAFAVAWAWATR